MNITPDTNFFISATQWDSSVTHKLLIQFIEQDISIFTTQEILEEFKIVLVRDFK
jgi:predicted nucleic acid-binding protein